MPSTALVGEGSCHPEGLTSKKKERKQGQPGPRPQQHHCHRGPFPSATVGRRRTRRRTDSWRSSALPASRGGGTQTSLGGKMHKKNAQKCKVNALLIPPCCRPESGDGLWRGKQPGIWAFGPVCVWGHVKERAEHLLVPERLKDFAGVAALLLLHCNSLAHEIGIHLKQRRNHLSLDSQNKTKNAKMQNNC